MADSGGMSFEDFKEQALKDATFSGKLQMLEGQMEPSNLKDRSRLVKDYMQDTEDQFRADTEIFNRLVEEVDLKWNGKTNQEGRVNGGMSDTTKRVFSWMKDSFDRLCEHRKKELARALQTMALQEAESNAGYDELARVYGNPTAAIESMLKLIDEQHKLITQLSAKDNEIQGQIKLGNK